MSTAHPAWSTARHLLSRATEWVDHKIGWHRLPDPAGPAGPRRRPRHSPRAEPVRHRDRHRSDTATRRRQRHHPPQRRRHLQRPRPSDDGLGRPPVRPQRQPAHGPARDRHPPHPEPAAGQPPADDARHVPARHVHQPAGGDLDPVHGQGLDQPRLRRRHPPVHPRPGRRRPLARRGPTHDHPVDHPGPDQQQRTDRLPQREHALVGRLLHLRRHRPAAAAHPRPARHPRRGQDGPADHARRSRHRSRPRAGLLGRARHHGRDLRPRAQRRLRGARRRQPAMGRRRDLPASPPGHLRADRQDPHRAMDPRSPRPPHHRRRPARQLVRPRRPADQGHLRPDQPQRGDQRHRRRSHRPLRRPLHPDRGVHDRLPDASADPRRLPDPLLAHR